MYCAFYEKEITPPIGCQMPGYYIERISTGVQEKLYVKSFAASSDEKNNISVIIAIDAVELPRKFCDEVVKRLREFTNIPQENIAICATHTHLGVPCGEPIGSKEDIEYMSWLCKISADCAYLAIQRLQPCTIHYGVGKAEGFSFNRNYIMKDGSIKTNPVSDRCNIVRAYSGVDTDVPVLVAKDLDGNPIGVLLSYACHQDCIGGSCYSGDYSSIISQELKKIYGENFISLYVAGTCGDINHIDPTKSVRDKDLYKHIGKKLAEEAIGVIEKSKPIEKDFVACQTEWIKVKTRRATEKELEAAYLSQKKEKNECSFSDVMNLLLLKYEELNKNEDVLPISVFVIGDVFFYALPGELYHNFGEQLKNETPSQKTLVATLANGVYGYFPIPELFGTGIYETLLCEGSCHEPQAGNKIVEKALEIANNIKI